MKTLPPGLPRSLAAAIGIGLSAAFLLCGYEGVRSSSNTLFKEAYGKESLPLIMTASPFVLLALLYGYGVLLSKFGPRRTLFITTVLSGFGVELCYYLILDGHKPATAALYLIREAYIVILIEQYWSFINSTLGLSTAKKLNGPICALGSCGGILGGYLVGTYSGMPALNAMTIGGYGPFEPLDTLALCVVSLIPAMLLGEVTYELCGEPQPEAGTVRARHGPLALGELKRFPLLLCIFGIILCTQAVAAMLDLTLQNQLSAAYPGKAQNKVSGNIYMWLNVAALVSQVVITPLLCSLVRLSWIHFALPVLNLAAIALLLLHPSFENAVAAHVLFKTFDYSLFKSAKELLYIPFPFDVRYRAKEFIDAFGYRMGKGVATIPFIFWPGSLFVWVGVALGSAAGWLSLVIPLARFWKRGPESTSMPAQTEASTPQ